MARFFDSHAHLDGERFAEDLPEVLDRAEAAGLTDIVCIGASDGFDTNPAALAIVEANQRPGLSLHATIGLHPHDAIELDDAMEGELEQLARHERTVAVGEIGLDYFYERSPQDAQRSCFSRMIRMAKRVERPIVIHTRDAEADTIRILDEEGGWAGGGVLHCFTGSDELAEYAVARGFYISFSGIMSFPKAPNLRELAKKLPRERVLIETDCPYLAPVPKRGKRNEPAFVQHTAACLAEQWGLSVEETRAITGDNAARLFGLS